MNSVFKDTFGLEISNTALKAVELTYAKEGVRIVNYSTIELEPGIVVDSCIIINKEGFTEALKKLLLEAKRGPINAKNVAISIPQEKTFSHQIEIPKENAKDRDYIKNAAKDYIPIELSEAVVDYTQIKENPENKSVTFNFVAIQKNLVEALITILDEAGLNVIAVDVNKNSLIRYCDNRFQKNENGFMVFDIDIAKSILTITTKNGRTYSVNIDITGGDLNNKIKDVLQVTSKEDLNTLLIKFADEEGEISEVDRNKVKESIKEELGIIIKNTQALIQAIESQESFTFERIYLIGSHSHTPGLKESFQEKFPEAEIKRTPNYINAEREIKIHYAETIGLTLRAVLPEEIERHVNLVPKQKKEEIDRAKMTPKVMKYSLWLYLVLVVMLLLTGIMITDSYLNFKISEQEVGLYTEKAQNPYLTQVAKATQQKKLLENQILTITSQVFPVSLVIDKIDDYNINGIGIVNLSYSLNKQGDNELRLRAKVANRSLTEEFISDLESLNIFSAVDSPLSNLVGKGERFVNIDFILDTQSIVDAYSEKQTQEEENVKSGPSLPASTENEEDKGEEIINNNNEADEN